MFRILGLVWAVGCILPTWAIAPTSPTVSPTFAPTQRPTSSPTTSPSNSPHRAIISPDVLQKLVGTADYGPAGTFSQVGLTMDISLNGNYMAITSPNLATAWVYSNLNGTWIQRSFIQPDGIVSEDANKMPISISGDGMRVVTNDVRVVQPGEDDYGGIFIYDYDANVDAWFQQQPTFFISNPLHQSTLSSTISGDGNLIALGCPYDDYSQGITYLLEYNATTNSWHQVDQVQVIAEGMFGFGNSVDFSYDGTTLAVGSGLDGSGNSYAGVFIRSAYDRLWYQQGSTLVGTTHGDPTSNQLICVVSLASDGNTLVMSNEYDVYIFSREERLGLWTESQYIHVPLGVQFVTLSPNAMVVSISRVLTSDPPNAVVNFYVYDAPTSEWILNTRNEDTQASDATEYNFFGIQMAFSYDASTWMVTGTAMNDYTGGFWSYSYQPSLNEWTQETNVLVPSVNHGLVSQGISFDVSQDGSRVVIGSIQGIWMFEQDANGVWKELNGGVVFGTNVTGSNNFGGTTVMSADGTTVAVSSTYNDGNYGYVWIFIRTVFSNGTVGWIQQAGPLRMRNDVSQTIGYFGTYLAISADGNLFAGSAIHNNINVIGIFVRDAQGNWSQQGPMLIPPTVPGADYTNGGVMGMTSDGSYIVVGATSELSGLAIFARQSNQTWVSKGTIVGVYQPGVLDFTVYGQTVAMNAEGTVLVFNGITSNSDPQYIFTFMKNEHGEWIQFSDPITLGQHEVPSFVSLSSDSNTLMIVYRFFTGIYQLSLAESRWVPITINSNAMFIQPKVNIETLPEGYVFISDLGVDDYEGAVFVYAPIPTPSIASVLSPSLWLGVYVLFLLTW